MNRTNLAIYEEKENQIKMKIENSYNEFLIAEKTYQDKYNVFNQKKEFRDALIKIRTKVSNLGIELNNCYEDLLLGLQLKDNMSENFKAPDNGSIMERVESLKNLRSSYFDSIIQTLTLDIIKLENELVILEQIKDSCLKNYNELLSLY